MALQHMPGMYLDPEMVMPLFLGTAIVFVVLAVRSVPSKLILLGVLAMAAGICLIAIHPVVATPALVMAVLAGVLVLAGLACVVVPFLVQTFTSVQTQAGPKL